MTHLKRTTCALYIESLLAKDSIVRTRSGKRTKYLAVAPQHLLIRLQKQQETAEHALSDLQTLYQGSRAQTKIRFYEGKREIKHIYQDMFQTMGTIYSIFPPRAFFKHFSYEEYAEFDQLISQHACRSRDLIVGDEHFRKVQTIRAEHPTEQKQTKRLPATFRSNIDLLIFRDKAALISLRDLSAVVLENPDIAHFFKQLHEYIWTMKNRRLI